MTMIILAALLALLSGCAIKGENWLQPQFDIDELSSTTLSKFHMANGNKAVLRRTQNGQNQLKFYDTTGLAGKIYDVNASNVSVEDSAVLTDGVTVILLKTPDYDCNHQYRIIHVKKNGDTSMVYAKGCQKMETGLSPDKDGWYFETVVPNAYYPIWVAYEGEYRALQDVRLNKPADKQSGSKRKEKHEANNSNEAINTNFHVMMRATFKNPNKTVEEKSENQPIPIQLR
jgi:hypothetical protein